MIEGISQKGVRYACSGADVFVERFEQSGEPYYRRVLSDLRWHCDWGYLATLVAPCIPSTLTHQDIGALVDGAIELHANPAYRMDAQRRAT